jgi:hypothetical protein
VVAVSYRGVVLPTTISRLAFGLAWQVGWLRFIWFVRVCRKLTSFAEIDAGTAGVKYSRNYFGRYSPDARIFWNLFLLCSIPDLNRDSLLIIGPRYETELLFARSLGFRRDGVRGLDTHS